MHGGLTLRRRPVSLLLLDIAEPHHVLQISIRGVLWNSSGAQSFGLFRLKSPLGPPAHPNIVDGGSPSEDLRPC